MPRKEIGERSESWEISMRDEILFPKLSRKHKKMSQLIARTYDSIDAIYEHVAKILDENGIFGSYRLTYKAYAQELWRICQTYSGKARESGANAIAVKYWSYGCDDKVLREIGRLFGLEVEIVKEVVKEVIKEVIKEVPVVVEGVGIPARRDIEGSVSVYKQVREPIYISVSGTISYTYTITTG